MHSDLKHKHLTDLDQHTTTEPFQQNTKQTKSKMYIKWERRPRNLPAAGTIHQPHGHQDTWEH
jgi:hypothetical protein